MPTFPSDHACSALSVRAALERRYPDHFMPFVDLFAMGCMLHLQGERQGGYRMIAQVIGNATDPFEEACMADLLDNLAGNEAHLTREIAPNAELGMRATGPGSRTTAKRHARASAAPRICAPTAFLWRGGSDSHSTPERVT